MEGERQLKARVPPREEMMESCSQCIDVALGVGNPPILLGGRIALSADHCTFFPGLKNTGYAEVEKLAVFDIYPRYAGELKKGPNMLNYRRYPLVKIPRQYHALVKPFVNGPSVEVMGNELDAILGDLPGWYGDRHPNLAGYNVIADETAKYLAKRLREKKAR